MTANRQANTTGPKAPSVSALAPPPKRSLPRGVPRARLCRHCAYASTVRGGEPNELICVNCPLARGLMTRVQPDGTCPNFRAEWARQRPPTPDPPNDKVRYIALTRGLFAQVDATDYPQLSKYNWCAILRNGRAYATRHEKGRTIYMHRQIVGAPKGLVVDHIDRDTLNNRRQNLRICTQRQNTWNTAGRGGTSCYKGVWYRKGQGYQAVIYVKGRKITSGWFDDPAEAARVRDRLAYNFHGRFAYLNFPQETMAELMAGTPPPDGGGDR